MKDHAEWLRRQASKEDMLTCEDMLQAADEIERLKAENEWLQSQLDKSKAEARIKGEWIRSRQCPDHSGKWERGRCLQCEIEELRLRQTIE